MAALEELGWQPRGYPGRCGGFGERPGETGREQFRHRVPGQLSQRPRQRPKTPMAYGKSGELGRGNLAIGERTDGPVFLAGDGRRLDRHGAGRIVRRVAGRAGITKPVTPRTLRHAFITAALDAGVPFRDVQEAASHADPRTTMRYDRARGSLDRHGPILLPPTSQAPPDSLCQRGSSSAWRLPPSGGQPQSPQASSGNRSQPSAERDPPIGAGRPIVDLRFRAAHTGGDLRSRYACRSRCRENRGIRRPAPGRGLSVRSAWTCRPVRCRRRR